MRIFVLSVVVGLSVLFLIALSSPTEVHAASRASSSSSHVVLLFRQTAARNGLPANLLMAIAWYESHWNQAARGWDAEIGVMQLMPATARGLNVQSHTHYNCHFSVKIGRFNIIPGAV